MIRDQHDFQAWLETEIEQYRQIGYKGRLHAWLTQCEIGKIVLFQTTLRKDELYTNRNSKNPLHKLAAFYYRRKHNILGTQLGLRIPVNTFGKGLLIYHPQAIIVHADSRCGDFCKLHGCNCIGNSGSEAEDPNTPILGDRVDLGIGAKIIGGVRIADNTVIAAGAVVCKSCDIPGSVLAGIPAKILK